MVLWWRKCRLNCGVLAGSVELAPIGPSRPAKRRGHLRVRESDRFPHAQGEGLVQLPHAEVRALASLEALAAAFTKPALG